MKEKKIRRKEGGEAGKIARGGRIDGG